MVYKFIQGKLCPLTIHHNGAPLHCLHNKVKATHVHVRRWNMWTYSWSVHAWKPSSKWLQNVNVKLQYIMWCYIHLVRTCETPFLKGCSLERSMCIHTYVCVCIYVIHTSSVTYIPMYTSTGIKVEMPSALYANSPFISDASDVSNLSTIHQATKSVSPCSVSEDQLISTESPALTLDMMQEKVKVCNCWLCSNSCFKLF